MQLVSLVRRHKGIVLLLVIVSLSLIIQSAPAPWASPSSQPSRQTVIQPAGTPTPTLDWPALTLTPGFPFFLTLTPGWGTPTIVGFFLPETGQ